MKVIIFYGTDCNQNTAWIPWVKEQLINRGIECVIPNLPTPENQNFKKWSSITNNVKINDNDIVVGWSTGAIFSLRYLYENDIKCNKLILISGFNNYIGSIPFVDNINRDFFMDDIKVARSVAKEIICIKSDNDPFITQAALNEFCDNLDARYFNIVNGGHFNSNAGFNKFPELLQMILG